MKTLYCWFVRDVTAGVHVGGQEQKHFAPLGTKLCCDVYSSKKKFYCVDPQHSRLVTWLQSKSITYLCFPLGFHRRTVIDVVL